MPGIITQRRFNQQPQHSPQIDWSNPITRGLCFAVVGNDPRDLVSGKGPSTWNRQTADASAGRTLVGAGSGQTAEYSFNPVIGSNGNGTGNVTLMSLANPFSESREGQLIGVTMNGSPFKQIGLFANFDGNTGSASAGKITLETYNGGNPSYGSATGFIDGKFHAYLGVFANGNCSMFVDGVDRTTASLANNGNFGMDASSRISIGSESYNSTTRAANAKISLSLAWNRVLTGTEAQSLALNPWQLFSAPPSRIWSKNSAGQAYTYSATGGILVSGVATKIHSRLKTSTGGIQTGGTATVNKGISKISTGGLQYSGTSLKAAGKAFLATGGIILGGNANRLVGAIRVITGGILFSGASNVQFTNGFQNRVVIPIGGILLAGTSAIRRELNKSSIGGITFGGSSGYFSGGQSIGQVWGTLNDVIYQKLKLMGKAGSRNDMLNENVYWRALAGGNNILSLNDVKKKVLREMGYTGTNNQMEKKYWSDL